MIPLFILQKLVLLYANFSLRVRVLSQSEISFSPFVRVISGVFFSHRPSAGLGSVAAFFSFSLSLFPPLYARFSLVFRPIFLRFPTRFGTNSTAFRLQPEKLNSNCPFPLLPLDFSYPWLQSIHFLPIPYSGLPSSYNVLDLRSFSVTAVCGHLGRCVELQLLRGAQVVTPPPSVCVQFALLLVGGFFPLASFTCSLWIWTLWCLVVEGGAFFFSIPALVCGRRL